MSRRLYALHRWLGALVFLQFAAWVISGLSFVILPEERVGGSPVPHAHEAPLGGAEGAVTPAAAAACFASMGLTDLHRVELRATPAGLFYVGRTRDAVARLDARTCRPAPVTAEEAEAAARRDQPGSPGARPPVLIEKDAPLEYRTKPLPAYRVELTDPDATAVYVDARTGDVTARRNGTWRAFDFFYALHIMRYETRSGLNNPLLGVAALLALITVLAGFALWMIRLARWIKARRAPARPRDAAAQ